LIALLAAVGCDQQPVAPATDQVAESPLFAPHGNDNKVVWPFQFYWDVDCGGGQILDVDFSGTGQFMLKNGKRNIELNIWHNTWLYTNAAGGTFRWIDTGPDRFYYDENGDLIITVTGTSTASGPGRDEVNVGHMVFNIDTGEVEFIAGRDLGTLDDMACGELY
jgi:hypothetical protein